MSMKRKTRNRSLPEEILMEILSWLPGKILVRFKSVSKSMLNLIMSPDFVKFYLRRSDIQNSTTVVLIRSNNNFALADLDQPQRPAVKLDIHPDVIKLLAPLLHKRAEDFFNSKIIGIRNGVVCFRNRTEFILYNLATRVYYQVPKPKEYSLLYSDEFVYDCISDDFKIFRFVRELVTHMGSESYMYNLKDNLWSKIGNPPPATFRLHRSCNHIATNYLNWISYKMDLKVILLVRFDVSSNTYEEMPLPTRVLRPDKCDNFPILGVLNGRLHVTRNGENPEIWMLNEDNCWTLVFHCSEWEYKVKRCLFYSIDGRKIFLGLKKKVRKFICCHLDSQTTSIVDILGLPEGATFKVMPYFHGSNPYFEP